MVSPFNTKYVPTLTRLWVPICDECEHAIAQTFISSVTGNVGVGVAVRSMCVPEIHFASPSFGFVRHSGGCIGHVMTLSLLLVLVVVSVVSVVAAKSLNG